MKLHAAVASILGLALCAAAPAGAQTSAVIAKSGDVELGGAEVRAIVDKLPVATRTTVAGNLPALEEVVRNELARRAVLGDLKAKGFDKDPRNAAQLDRVRDEALLRLWLADRAQVPAGYPTDDDVRKAFDASKMSLSKPTEYRLAQIFIAAPDGGETATLNAALRKAASVAGKVGVEDFAKLARETSEHAASAAKGGDLGFLADNRLLPEIASAVRGKKAGETIGPLKTAQGLHFVKVLEVETPAAPTLEESRAALVSLLRNQRRQQLENEYLAQLTAKANVAINQIELARLQQTLKTSP